MSLQGDPPVTKTDVDPICVVVGRTRHRMVQAETQEAARRGARLIEIRLDLIKRPPDFKRLLADKPCPLVATVRRPEDGGLWNKGEEARLMLLRQAIVAGFDWVDLETDVIDRIPRFKDVRRIVSYHNLAEVPDNLEELHRRMCNQDADVVKIAVRANHPLDNLRVLALLEKPTTPTVAFCMGDLGLPSRILGAKFGAPYTYAAFTRERTLAPGLPSLHDVQTIYRYREINANTQIFAVLGDPVAHSLSPKVHNAAFRQLGINAVYLPFRVPKADLVDTLKGFNTLPIRGYSVTIPHKEQAATLAAVQDPAVERIQAANTLIRTEDSGFTAYNTDYQAVLETLRARLSVLPATQANPSSTGIVTALPPEPEGVLQGKMVLVLGAGGIARAVAHALSRDGANLIISNRTPERATKLAGELGCRFLEWAGRHTQLCDILINCTAVGMHPNLDESPVHASILKPGMVVFDTVYTPETTLLVKEARERGCNVITGVDLFVRQAALQFRLFTGREPPVEVMRQVVKRALSPVALPEEEPPPPMDAGPDDRITIL
jgi:3-dehydroquinate dehydratase/shikimate dehydrogenase